MADHPADERVDGDEQGELGEVLAQPEPDRGVGDAGVVIDRCRGGGRWRPPRCRAAVEHADARWPRAVRRLAAVMARSPWPHMTVNGSSGKRGGGDGAELDVEGAGDVAGGVLVVLADIDDSARAWRRARPARWWRRGVRRLARRRCRRQLADESLVADVEALADQLVAVLVVVERRTRAAGPGRRASRASWRMAAATCWTASRGRARRQRGDRADIDDRAAGGEVGLDVIDAEPVEAGQRVVAARSAPVQLGKPGEVGGERAEPGQEPLDELVLVVTLNSGFVDPLTADRGRALRGTRGGAERPGAVGRVHGEVVGKLVVAAQRAEHLAGQRLGRARRRTDRCVRPCRPSATHQRTGRPAGRTRCRT